MAFAKISLALPNSLSIISNLAAEIQDKGFSGLVVIKLFNNNFAFFISCTPSKEFKGLTTLSLFNEFNSVK